jgi:arylsulfatase A-like enzyme
MLLTGRHPQTTGHVINFLRTRHDEIGIGDAFAHAGYRTAWVGKWHLHTGAFPMIDAADYVPEGRDRLGFEFWRGYNFHTVYFNGTVNREDWHYERWEGYETEALNRYAFEFMDDVGDEPFCLFVSPHQPHYTPHEFAPEHYYALLPEQLVLPENVPESIYDESVAMYRHYLAMTLALDDMVGDLLDYLERSGKAANTLVVFTSDHGTQVGAHGIRPWAKKMPYEESLRVPWIMRWPGTFDGGATRDGRCLSLSVRALWDTGSAHGGRLRSVRGLAGRAWGV